MKNRGKQLLALGLSFAMLMTSVLPSITSDAKEKVDSTVWMLGFDDNTNGPKEGKQGVNGWYFMYSKETNAKGKIDTDKMKEAEWSKKGSSYLLGEEKHLWVPEIYTEKDYDVDENGNWWFMDSNGRLDTNVAVNAVSGAYVWEAPEEGNYDILVEYCAGSTTKDGDGVTLSLNTREEKLDFVNADEVKDEEDFDEGVLKGNTDLKSGQKVYIVVDPKKSGMNDFAKMEITITKQEENVDSAGDNLSKIAKEIGDNSVPAGGSMTGNVEMIGGTEEFLSEPDTDSESEDILSEQESKSERNLIEHELKEQGSGEQKQEQIEEDEPEAPVSKAMSGEASLFKKDDSDSMVDTLSQVYEAAAVSATGTPASYKDSEATTWTLGDTSNINGPEEGKQGVNGWFFLWNPQTNKNGAIDTSQMEEQEWSSKGTCWFFYEPYSTGQKMWVPSIYTQDGYDFQGNSNWWNVDGNGRLEICVTKGGVSGAYAWEAPEDGLYDIILDYKAGSKATSGDGMILSMNTDTAVLDSYDAPAVNGKDALNTGTMQQSVSLKAGERVYFIADPKGNGGDDYSEIRVEINKKDEQGENNFTKPVYENSSATAWTMGRAENINGPEEGKQGVNGWYNLYTTETNANGSPDISKMLETEWANKGSCWFFYDDYRGKNMWMPGIYTVADYDCQETANWWLMDGNGRLDPNVRDGKVTGAYAWAAPRTGNYTVKVGYEAGAESFEWGGVTYYREDGVMLSINTKNKTIDKVDAPAVTEDNPNLSKGTMEQTVTLKAGELLYFVVDPQNDGQNDTAKLNITIAKEGTTVDDDNGNTGGGSTSGGSSSGGSTSGGSSSGGSSSSGSSSGGSTSGGSSSGGSSSSGSSSSSGNGNVSGTSSTSSGFKTKATYDDPNAKKWTMGYEFFGTDSINVKPVGSDTNGPKSGKQGSNGWYFLWSPQTNVGAKLDVSTLKECIWTDKGSCFFFYDSIDKKMWVPDIYTKSGYDVQKSSNWWMMNDHAYLHPNVSKTGAVSGAYAWRAPVDGTYSIKEDYIAGGSSLTYEGVTYYGENGVTLGLLSKDGALQTVKCPNTTKNHPNYYKGTISKEITLKAGEAVYFAVDPNQTGDYDYANLRITIQQTSAGGDSGEGVGTTGGAVSGDDGAAEDGAEEESLVDEAASAVEAVAENVVEGIKNAAEKLTKDGNWIILLIIIVLLGILIGLLIYQKRKKKKRAVKKAQKPQEKKEIH